MRRGLAWKLLLVVTGLVLLAVLGGLLAEDYTIARAEDALTPFLKTKALDVTLQTATDVSFLPTPQLNFNNIELHEQDENRSAPAVVLDRMTVDVAWLPLLWGEVKIQSLRLEQPTVRLLQRADGSFGLTLQQVEAGLGAGPFAVEVRGGSIRILDKAGAQLVAAKQCDFTSSAMRVAETDDRLPARLDFNGLLKCAELRRETSVLEQLQADITAREGIYDIALQAQGVRNAVQDQSAKLPASPVSASSGQGRLTADFSGAQPQFEFQYQATDFAVGPFLKGRWSDLQVQGQIDLDLEIQFTGQDVQQLKRSTNGRLSVRGQNLSLEGIDLDRWLADIERSQGFGVVDIGAVIFGGPFGLVLTQAYDVASLATKTPGQSRVQQLVSDWTIEAGIAQARDVAFATEQHRLAVFGNTNLAEERYESLKVALITPEGCPILQQTIDGPISQPQIEPINALKRVTAPVVKLLKDAKETLTQEECEAIYTGAVVKRK